MQPTLLQQFANYWDRRYRTTVMVKQCDFCYKRKWKVAKTNK